MSYMKPYTSDHVFDATCWDNSDAGHFISQFNTIAPATTAFTVANTSETV